MDEVERAVHDLCESVGLQYDPSAYHSKEPMDDATIDVIITVLWEARGRTDIAPIVARPIGEPVTVDELEVEIHDEEVLRQAFLGHPLYRAPELFEKCSGELRSELRDLPLSKVMSALMNSNLISS